MSPDQLHQALQHLPHGAEFRFLDSLTDLDPGRRAALFARLEGRGQVWMTGTEPGLFEAVPGGATRYRVSDGAVSVE